MPQREREAQPLERLLTVQPVLQEAWRGALLMTLLRVLRYQVAIWKSLDGPITPKGLYGCAVDFAYLLLSRRR
jgi:hypothetical protein